MIKKIGIEKMYVKANGKVEEREAGEYTIHEIKNFVIDGVIGELRAEGISFIRMDRKTVTYNGKNGVLEVTFKTKNTKTMEELYNYMSKFNS